jgi:hypothetical protein
MKKNLCGVGRGAFAAFLGLSGVTLSACSQGVTSEAEPVIASTFNVNESPCPDVGLDAPRVVYVCDCEDGADSECEPGDDANDGTISSPLRTYAAANQAYTNLNGGETVAFCRGGSFAISGDRGWASSDCNASAPCVIRDYQPPWSSAQLDPPTLTAVSANGMEFWDDGNQVEGLTVLNLDLRSTEGTQSSKGFFIYNDIEDALFCGVSVSGFGIGFAVEESQQASSSGDGKNADVVIRYSAAVQNSNQGYLGGCDGCVIEDSYFEDNGFGLHTYNHNIYLGARGADGMLVRNNYLYRSTFIDGECKGTSLVVHGVQTDLTIEGNTVIEDQGAAATNCWGITVDPGYGDEVEAFERVTIRGNWVENVGNTSIGIDACQDCVIENNVIVQTQDFESTLISVPDGMRLSNDMALDDATVRNNTLYVDSSAKMTGIAVGGQGNGHVVVSNALLSVGSGEVDCFNYDLAHSAYTARDNNLCYKANGSPDWTNTTASLPTWRVQSGDDLASQITDPLFANAPYDFTPANGSPLVANGHDTLSALNDYSGSTRDSQPDIGAIEQ